MPTHAFFGQHTGKGDEDADAEENIDHCKELRCRRGGTEVSIAHSRQRDHTKIQRIEPTPTLYQVIKNRTGQQNRAQPD